MQSDSQHAILESGNTVLMVGDSRSWNASGTLQLAVRTAILTSASVRLKASLDVWVLNFSLVCDVCCSARSWCPCALQCWRTSPFPIWSHFRFLWQMLQQNLHKIIEFSINVINNRPYWRYQLPVTISRNRSNKKKFFGPHRVEFGLVFRCSSHLSQFLWFRRTSYTLGSFCIRWVTTTINRWHECVIHPDVELYIVR